MADFTIPRGSRFEVELRFERDGEGVDWQAEGLTPELDLRPLLTSADIIASFEPESGATVDQVLFVLPIEVVDELDLGRYHGRARLVHPEVEDSEVSPSRHTFTVTL